MTWRQRRVSDMAELVNGHPFDSSLFRSAGDVPLVRIRDVLGDCFETFLENEAAPESSLIRSGDVVIGMDGDFNLKYWDRGRAALNQRLCLLRDNGTSDMRFLAYSLPTHLGEINDLTYATTVKHLSSADVRAIRLGAPDLSDQRVIADYLDRETARIDTLIEEQERLTETLRERRQAALEKAVAGVAAHGARLKHVIRQVRQGWSPQCYSWSADGIDQWAVLKAGAANGGVFRPAENKELPEDKEPRPDVVVRQSDLLVSRANTLDLVGSAAVVTGSYPRLMLCDKLYAFTLDAELAHPPFVAAVLSSRRWRALIQGEATGASHSMLNISQSDIVNLPMPIGPIAEQRRIAAYLNEQTAKIDTLIAETERFIELSRERRAALITAAVTGQIDVREMA